MVSAETAAYVSWDHISWGFKCKFARERHHRERKAWVQAESPLGLSKRRGGNADVITLQSSCTFVG